AVHPRRRVPRRDRHRQLLGSPRRRAGTFWSAPLWRPARRRRHPGARRRGAACLKRSIPAIMATTIVALDLPTADAALALVDRLGDAVDWYKVGAPLYTRSGPAVVDALHSRGKKVFLDLKYHDIPNTVAQAVEAAAE